MAASNYTYNTDTVDTSAMTCAYWYRSGYCRKGHWCKYAHTWVEGMRIATLPGLDTFGNSVAGGNLRRAWQPDDEEEENDNDDEAQEEHETEKFSDPSSSSGHRFNPASASFTPCSTHRFNPASGPFVSSAPSFPPSSSPSSTSSSRTHSTHSFTTPSSSLSTAVRTLPPSTTSTTATSPAPDSQSSPLRFLAAGKAAIFERLSARHQAAETEFAAKIAAIKRTYYINRKLDYHKDCGYEWNESPRRFGTASPW